MSHHNNAKEPPFGEESTVLFDQVISLGALTIMLLLLTTSFLSLTTSLWITIILLFGFLAISYQKYLTKNKAYTALLLVNNFWHSTRAVIVPGWVWKSPAETVARRINLHRQVVKLDAWEFSTKGPDRFITLTLDITPDTSGNPTPKLRKWALYEHAGSSSDAVPASILTAAKAIIRGILSPYFEGSEGEEAMSIEAAYAALDTPQAREKLAKFASEHGACIAITIEDIDRSEEERDMLDLLSGIKNINKAIIALMEKGIDGKGMSRPEAEEYVKLRTLPNVNQMIWKVEAPDGMTHFAPVVAGGVNPGSSSSTKKRRHT